MAIEAPSTGAAVAAGGSGAATVISALSEASTQILGVPLPVVLAALTGAWVARSYTPAKNLFSAMAATAGWMVLGCALAPLAQACAKRWLDLELPTNALAGIAGVVAAALPLVLPIIAEKLPEIVRARLDRLKGGGS